MGFFSRYRFVVLVAVFLLATLAIFSINASRDTGDSPLSQAVLEAAGPVQRALTWVGDSIDYVFSTYVALINASRDNRELTKEVARLKQQLVQMEELRLANTRLGVLLGLKRKTDQPSVAAVVVASDPTSRFSTVIINKGSSDGLRTNMPVVGPAGLVGRIVSVSPHYAKVLLLSDPNTGVDVVVQRSRARGLVEGAGGEGLRLKYVVSSNDVAPGDRLLTSGLAGVFPAGLVVGTVSKVSKDNQGLFLQVSARPAVDFNRLEEVLVVLHQPSFDK